MSNEQIVLCVANVNHLDDAATTFIPVGADSYSFNRPFHCYSLLNSVFC